MVSRRLIILLSLSLLLLSVSAFGFTNKVNYQGRVVGDDGIPSPDGFYLVQFSFYDSPVGGTELWSSGFRKIWVENGLFSYLIGDTTAIPVDFFKNNSPVYLGVTVGANDESQPRMEMAASAFAFHAFSAEQADYAMISESTVRGRDLYHNIIDISPNSATTVPFITFGDNSEIILYLYGSEFQAPLAEHTHAGNNEHQHELNATVASASALHSHTYSGTSAAGGKSHTHDGSTSAYNLSHNHGGTGSTNPSHNHSGTATSSIDSQHRHNFLFSGYKQDHFFLVHRSDPTALTADGTGNVVATASVDPVPSSHTHVLSINNQSISHSHTISSWGSNHSHTFTSGIGSVDHAHNYSGSTASNSTDHSHSLTGSTTLAGLGLETAGINPSATVGSVSVYVDGSYAAGPFFGVFSTGEINLSSFVTVIGEHIIEIIESGGSGGRISYNLFVK